jgi:hypothetical protein
LTFPRAVAVWTPFTEVECKLQISLHYRNYLHNRGKIG